MAKKPAKKKPAKRAKRERKGLAAKRRAPPAEASTTAASRAPAPPGAPERGAERKPTTERGSAGFPIVAIGASAGGLDAFKQFLAAVRPDSGMAFVLIPHLDPAHESLMVELLSRQTSIPVTEATHGTKIGPNHVYVIPPNKYLAVDAGRLVLSEPPKPHRLQTAIDFALRSLARDQLHNAIGIVLSGTGAHGALGVREIKAAGGMVMAQSPESAEYDQMPRSAIATGLVDYVLAPGEMPAALIDYARRARLPEEPAAAGAADAGDLSRIVALLRARTKYDFRHYRKNMLLRRVHRRLGMLRLDSMAAYLECLRGDTAEVRALCKDLLIGVTSFFREPEAFDVLEQRVLPGLIEGLEPDMPIRVWVPGCSTGEEAYSIGMLLMEQFQKQNKPPNVQLFATDIDDDALDVARQGIYADSIAGAMAPERLRRFFTKVDEQHYRIDKALREFVVVAPQNLITDAPFSRLHLISCRNVLIYLNPDVQAKILSLLHFALNDGGYLLLGPSESIGAAVDMFEPVSKHWRVFRRIGPVRHDRVSIPIAAAEERTGVLPGAVPPRRAAPSFTEVMQRLLTTEFAPASCLVNRKYEVLCIQGPLVDYLEFPPGEPSKDLLAMARQGLRTKLRAACHAAIRGQHAVTETDARVKRNSAYVPCSITVRPLVEPKEVEGLLLVVFQDRAGAGETAKGAEARTGEESPLVEQLEDELQATREDLQSTIEELESSNEELKASNEEVMSMNEELQSANEELETSKEELQSLNEELATVNSQLQDRIEDLGRESDDMANLMAATEIATIFLDADLNIKRFTPPTGRLLNLLATDVGRPFRNFAPKFTDDTLAEDCERVLRTAQPVEKEIHSDEDRWYLRRILPYRTTGDRIGGVVVTFIDVTERVRAEARARRLADVLLQATDAVIVRDLSGRIIAWNRGAETLYGYSEADAQAMRIRDIVPDDSCDRTAEFAQRIQGGETIEPFETQRRTLDGRVLHVWVSVTAQKDDAGRPAAIATVERDITARRHAEGEARRLNEELEARVAERTAALQASEHRIRAVLDSEINAIVTIDEAGRIETINRAAERMFGYSASDAVGRDVETLFAAPYQRDFLGYLRRWHDTVQNSGIGATRELTGRSKDGAVFPVELSIAMVDDLGLFTLMIRDLTEQKTLQQEILQIATLEQRRIGQELHDSTQQELTGLGLLAQNLSDALAGSAGPERELAEKLAAGIEQTNHGVRAIAKGLLPVELHAETLMSALSELAEDTSREHRLRCRFECPEPVEIADDVTATHLYRIAQEAVTNAVKHAEASTITIRLEQTESMAVLKIRDDGVGFEVSEATRRGLGLRTMTYRCSLIGGTLIIDSADGGGTRVVCSLLPRPPR
jgi:two-component system CheB/CheR fusion protein